MNGSNKTSNKQTITVLGGTGHVGVVYTNEFLAAGLNVRILARSPEKVAGQFTGTEIMQGSMMNETDVAQSMENADAAFLITPIGGNDDAEIELRAARTAIAAALKSKLPHLIFVSLIKPGKKPNVPLLEVKHEIEEMLDRSSTPWSSLRTGFYMEDVLELKPDWIKKGWFFFPINPCHKISWTSQRDVARVAVVLLQQGHVLNSALDVIEPVNRTLNEAANLAGQVLGRKVKTFGRFMLPVMKMLRSLLFRYVNPVMASKVRMLSYFNKNDYVGKTNQLADVFPGFEVTSMETYLKKMFSK